MLKEQIKLNGYKINVISLNTAIVGSGAAGLNAADRLATYGQHDIAIITEGLKKGTSRNTGSDKQTYYKLTTSGKVPDSIQEMAETLFSGGAVDGDLELVEAALSTQSFFHLVEIGVPFPHNQYGEYVGYKTDHDPRQRATSAGPLTSKYMTEKLEKNILDKNIPIFAGYQVISILTDKKKEKVVGLLTLNLNKLNDADQRFVLFNCTNVVYATGGPAGIYAVSVYPESQTGSSGIALAAGVRGKNLTESQYGIASIEFRWNLSGTYQQVLPRYISTDQSGNDEKEFLNQYFSDPGKMLDAIFLKGYQWPFDPRKVLNYGSSLIDILVYNEMINKKRRVWLDYTKNPAWASENGKLKFSLLNQESYQYLKNSGVLFGTPIERLTDMNRPAVELYRQNGIDLKNKYLEIAVCAQHNNGGLDGNNWWESNLKHFFPVGEVNGSHGVYRPGGSALNAGQVGSMRAAQYITVNYQESPVDNYKFIKIIEKEVKDKLKLAAQFLAGSGGESNVGEIRATIGERMTKYGAHIRSLKAAEMGAKETYAQFLSLPAETKTSQPAELGQAFKNWDLLLTQYVYFKAIENYIERGGLSRGSYLIYNQGGTLPVSDLAEKFRFRLDNDRFKKQIQRVFYEKGNCKFEWESVRPIPENESWFENVWKKYLEGNIIN